MKFFDNFKKKVKTDVTAIDNEREDLENKAANAMDTIRQNPTFIKLENQGADELVALGIQAGIALAESASHTDIPVSQDAINKVADKGGDILVKFVNKIIGLIINQLRK